jgi:hypothetical protein
MSVYNDLRIGECCVERVRRGAPELVSVGNHDVKTIQFQHGHLGKRPAQLHAIGVAIHRRDRSQRMKLAEYAGVTYVAGMKNVVNAFESIEDLRAQKTVRVGDDPEAHTGRY